MKTVFFDVDTQIDFLFPAGALYVPGAETIVPVIASLNRYAARNKIPIISTADAHSEDDPEFRDWHPHCVVDTVGQQKPKATLVEGAEQILVLKQKLDCFSNPALPGILDRLGADRFVVYGVVTEFCVKCAAFGLLERGGRVELITDAIKSISDYESKRIIREFTGRGGTVTTSAGAMAPS